MSDKDVGEDSLKEACKLLTSALKTRYKDWDGVNQFDGTSDRLFRLYKEFCWPIDKIESEVAKAFKVFDQEFSEMVVASPIRVWILCPHHLLPCKLDIAIGYIPSSQSKGKVLGLSKLVRVAEILGHRPILQEQYVQDLVSTFETYLKPQGVAVYVRGEHGCMGSRGVRQSVPIHTSVVTGSFKDEGETRQEFFSIVRYNGVTVV